MTAIVRDLYIEQGATFTFTFTWSNGVVDQFGSVVAGTPKDLTGFLARMQIRRIQGDPAQITADTTNGRIVLGRNAANPANMAMAAPVLGAPTTATTGGTLAAGTYYYVVTAIGPAGETVRSNEVSQVTTGTTSTVSLTWGAVTGATKYRVYRGTATGVVQLVTTLGNVTAYTDTGTATTATTPPVAPDPTNGRITVTLSDEDTDSLTAKTARYDLEVENPAGDVFRLLQGKVTVDGNITQEGGTEPVPT